MRNRKFHAFADDAFVSVFRRPDQIGAEDQDRIVGEGGVEAFLRKFNAVAFDTREADFQGVTFGTHGLDLNGFARKLRRGDDRFGSEIEGDTEHVGILDIEEAFFVEVVGLAAQGAADDLFAKKLGAEGADAEHMGDGVRIPTFGEHGDRDHATDRTAKLVGLAHGIHDLTQKFLVGDIIAGTGVAGAFYDLAAEAFDLVGSHGAKVVVECIAGFELFGVDQQGVGAGERVAGGFVKVSEESEASVFERGGAVLILALEAGDVVVNEFGDSTVLADDNKARRYLDAAFLPEFEGLVVVAVESLERGLKSGWQFEGVEYATFTASGLGHVLADVLPEIAEDGQLVAGDVFGHRNARQFDDAALDGVHEGEVAHSPGKERAFGITRAAQEEGCGGEIDDAGEA